MCVVTTGELNCHTAGWGGCLIAQGCLQLLLIDPRISPTLIKDDMPTLSAAADIELGKVRDGYPALARWIAQDPDNEPFVFRKFSRLGARYILHLQARLFALEHEIDQLDEAARTSSDPVARQASRRYETLIDHKNDAKRKEKERVQKLEELGSVLKKYRTLPCYRDRTRSS